MRVVVTSGEWEAALNCVQSLGRLGHEVYLLDARDDWPLIRSRYCSGHLASPPEYVPEYAEFLRRTVATGRYDVLIPISDRAVDVVSRDRDRLGEHVGLVLPDPKQIEIARDKALTTRLAADLGELIPQSYFPETTDEVTALAGTLTYPAVVKLPRGTASCGVFIVPGPAELIDCFAKHGRADNWPFVQQFVEGDIADVAAVCDHGEMVTYFSFFARTEHLVGGTPPYLESLADPALVEAAGRLVRHLEWHGAIDFDFIRTPAGKYYMLEINPRFSGSTNFAYKLGIDLPGSYLDLAMGRSAAGRQRPYESGWRFRTVVPAEVRWWRADRRRRTATVLAASVRRRTRTNIYWRDWGLVRAQATRAVQMLRRWGQ